jgi:hypothetical protein
MRNFRLVIRLARKGSEVRQFLDEIVELHERKLRRQRRQKRRKKK